MCFINIYKDKIVLIIKVLIIIIIFLFYRINFISKIIVYFSYIEKENEIKEMNRYFIIYSNNKPRKIKKFKKIKNPIISIISPIYNRERYLPRLIKSIQYQYFKDIEIILVDDFSIDNSVAIIERYQKEDQRIVLIKNKKNRGTFVTRNVGVLCSKGKYVIIPDPDDFISKNILNLCYYYAEKYKYEIIKFNSYIGKGKLQFNKIVNKLESRPIYQPELSETIFYGNNELQMIDYYIYNKFIKREVYIKALNELNNYYLNMYMIYLEDQVINYIIHRTAKSFYFLKNIGYYHKRASISIINNLFKAPDLIVKSTFIYLKFVFEYSKNIKHQKDMSNLLFTILSSQFNIAHRLFVSANNDDINFYYDIINKYLNSDFITNDNKLILTDFKNIIEKKRKYINSSKKDTIKE